MSNEFLPCRRDCVKCFTRTLGDDTFNNLTEIRKLRSRKLTIITQNHTVGGGLVSIWMQAIVSQSQGCLLL